MSCYKFLRSDAKTISRELRKHARFSCSDYYYFTRDVYNNSKASAAQAARFIYLNKTCFNGIFRVNLQGKFNVPYGSKEPPYLPTAEEVATAGEALKCAKLLAAPFKNSLSLVRRGDFVYLDPPYPALNGTSFFAHYTADRFGAANQEELASAVQDLNNRGALFLMSNADTPLVRKLYGRFQIHALDVIRYVTCKAQKHLVSELVITNYEAPAICTHA